MTHEHIHDQAVRYAMGKIMQSTDWQQVQDALSNHNEYGPWLDHDNGLAEAQSVIREAENLLGRLPAGYA